jgi:hypothetical protein
MRWVVVASILLAHAVCAQDSTLAVYDVVPDQSDDINAAIDSSVEHMFFIARPIARHRLRVNNPLPQHLRFDVTPDTITVHLGDQPPAALPRDGTAVPWVSGDGDKCRVSLVIAGDTLTEHIAAHGGQSDTRFVMMDSGRRVREDVRITSSHLPQPVVYSVMFVRSP